MARKDKGKVTGTRNIDGVEYTVVRIPAEKQPDYNTFDRMWSPGVLPSWIRTRGHQHSDDDERMFKPDYMGEGYGHHDYPGELFAYASRPAAEEPYVDALSDFFTDRIERWPGTITQKAYLHTIMHDKRSTREIGEAEGVDHTTIVHGRQRALESFVAWAGGKEALAEALRQYLVDREAQDTRDRLKYLPRWVHG